MIAPADPAPAADMREPARIAIFDAVVGYDCRNVNTAHHRTDVALEAVRPLLAAAPADPAPAADGWKLVPAEPTREMFMAGLSAIRTDNAEDNVDMPSLYPGTAAKCYRAMIAAAPPAPVGDEAKAAYDKMLTTWAESRARHLAAEQRSDALSARMAELMTERARMDTQYADLLAINVAAEDRAARMAEALEEIESNAMSGEWTLPSSFAAAARAALRERGTLIETPAPEKPERA